MASVLAFDDANTVKKAPGNYPAGKQKIPGAQTKFFGSRDQPELPHACLNQRDAGAVHVNRTHFHAHDQFQIVIAGTGRLGRHDLAPTCVHFTRAYTPYGPLVSDAATGLSFFVLRAHYDAGAQRMPEAAAQLKAVPNRQPWQVTASVTFPEFATGKSNADAILQPIEAVKDEHGLAGYTLIMKPNTRLSAPDASRGDGQYIVVMKGSLLHDNKEHKALALVFVGPKENQFPIHAGTQGLEALILNFPEPRGADAIAPKRAKTAGYKQWQCSLCSFFYDEALGMPHEGIAPGTRWEDVPDSWSCPDCAASKSDFSMNEV